MIQRSQFRFEYANLNHRLLIQEWFMKKHVQKILYEVGQKKISYHLEEFLQGKSSGISYWIGYYQNDPLALLIADSSNEGATITLDVIICNRKSLGHGLLTPMLYEFWKQTEDFWVLKK